jgi:CubicO group peptidase (beta-lactamase class C family)
MILSRDIFPELKMKASANIDGQLNGTVAPGFESIERLFQKNILGMAEKNVQLCVYYRGQRVVDLWSSSTGDKEFSASSLVNVFSSGKSLEAIAVAWLVSKNLLSYDDKITQHWPEFGANGKEGIVVADLMRHEAGLANFDTSLDMEDLFTDNIKQNSVGRLIESHAQNYKPGDQTRREYHALTRGWIVNELFRRLDPAGRTIGEFLREDISGPLDADAVIGVNPQQMARISKVKPLGIGYQLVQSLIPRFLGRRIIPNFFQLLARFIKIIPAMIKSRKMGAPPPFTGMTNMGFFNQPQFAMGETPSANASCSARGLAKIAAMMSAGGKWGGNRYLTEQAWSAMHANPIKAKMGGILTTRFTQGGVDKFTRYERGGTEIERAMNEGREGFYGWMGFGGSILQWHPGLDIGFAFVPTSLHVLDLFNERGKVYQAEILKCTANLRSDTREEPHASL